MADDRIMERIYIKGDLLLTSPLIRGSGENENTDIDIVRDWDGKPFIPGTSLAGAIRHYLCENYRGGADLADNLFGKRGKESRQSLIVIHDAKLVSEEKILVRDGVHLDYATRTVVTDRQDSKYDYEILDTGQRFVFKIEAIRRNNSELKSEEIQPLIGKLLSCLRSGEISVGAKTRRGYGRLQLENERLLVLDMSIPEDVEKWINFEWESFEGNKTIEELDDGTYSPEEKAVAINVKFKIPYSILIRHYSEKEEYKDVDVSHIQSNDKSVIPGTSWNGAIRHAAYQILLDLDVDETNAKKLINEIFGFVDEKHKDAVASRLSVKESIIENRPNLLKYTRNKVDRFTGGVVETALFDEMPHYQGTVELDVRLKKEDEENDRWRLALIKMALMDIVNGIQPVGGGANIGRGILEIVEDIEITDEEYQALKNKLEA